MQVENSNEVRSLVVIFHEAYDATEFLVPTVLIEVDLSNCGGNTRTFASYQTEKYIIFLRRQEL